MHKVRLVEFKIEDVKKEDIEAELEGLLDEGFKIVSQHEAEGYLNMTLVRSSSDFEVEEDETPPVIAAAPPKYRIVNGAVERVTAGSGPTLH